MAFPHDATDLSAVCDCGIGWSYLLTFIFENSTNKVGLHVVKTEIVSSNIYLNALNILIACFKYVDRIVIDICWCVWQGVVPMESC